MTHCEFWTKVQCKAEHKVAGLFAGGDPDVSLERAVGHADGITSKDDLKRALAYVMANGDCYEKACAVMASASWMQAHNELKALECSPDGIRIVKQA